MLSENFARSGFRLSGLYLDIVGPGKAHLVLEFPLYNFLTGVLYKLTGSSVIWGKTISLVAGVGTLLVLWTLVEEIRGLNTARLTALFFIFAPEGMLLRTAVEPDALAIFFFTAALLALWRWRGSHALSWLLVSCAAVTLGALVKVTAVVPFLPLYLLWGLSAKRDETRAEFRIPRARELLALGIIVAAPVAAWYNFAQRFQAGVWGGFHSRGNFFIGDLTRFGNVSFYPQPIYALLAYLFCGTGLLLAIIGARRGGKFERALLLAVPLYYIAMPTLQYQHHYLYACVPLLAILFAEGWSALAESGQRRWRFPVLAAYAVVFIISTKYVLRHDNVITRSARALETHSDSSDLAAVLAMHDRIYVQSSAFPEFFYLSHRRGWNIGYARELGFDGILRETDRFRSLGASKLLVTTYDPSLEPWFAPTIPDALRRDPHMPQQQILNALTARFPMIASGPNYAIFSLKQAER
jgi:hypothetical protein